MIVKFYATLRQIVGGKAIDVQLPGNATIQQLLDEILQQHPALRPELFDEKGQLYQHVHVMVNGRDVPYLEDALNTVLSVEDVISIFPAVGGG